MSDEDGLIWACVLDGKGGASQVGIDEIGTPLSEGRSLWLHWDRKSPAAEQWLRERSGLDAIVCEALLAEETRPRSLLVGEGLLTTLRGVNLNEGAEPEDMTSIRAWIDAGRVITLRGQRVMAIQDIRDSLEQGKGPTTPGDFLVDLASRLIERMSPVLVALDETVDDLEEQVVEAQTYELRSRLGDVRRQAIALRRYLAPQRDVMAKFQSERVPWLTDLDRARLREAADRLTRYVEDLDASRERAAVTQEELAGRLSEQMNRTMYVLSLVAAVFLPLGLLTGLLGINVGGIPGTESNVAFAIVCVVLLVLAVVGIWAFRRLRFF
jgi:zinc transporter